MAAGTKISYWTSGNDLVKEGHWVWANNEEMDHNGITLVLFCAFNVFVAQINIL